jgi:hypothetical protein
MARFHQVLREQARPAPDLQDQALASPDILEKGQNAGRARLGVKAVALVENIGQVSAIIRLIGLHSGIVPSRRPRTLGMPRSRALIRRREGAAWVVVAGCLPVIGSGAYDTCDEGTP